VCENFPNCDKEIPSDMLNQQELSELVQAIGLKITKKVGT